MARRRQQSQFHEPSLVPLADMLTNTVGIVVFILIFTVLTTNGAMVTTRLPIEREVNIDATKYYICANGNIYPMHIEFMHELLSNVSRPLYQEGLREFATRITGTMAENEFLKITLIAEYQEESNVPSLSFRFLINPKPQAGLASNQIMNADGFFA